ncbi:MAG: divergent polysaccharide deacetylase family protein, partial [Sphingomonadales bacterium]|nr:divergent polysaccharide deacetylase family protein [Sphingomonadales bacterium]
RQNMTRSFAALPTVINFSFLPYAEGLSWQTQLMNEAGHELMLHMPMEPSVAGQNPGPKALLTSMSVDTIDEYLSWNLSRFDGFVGINNHMGSRFTENATLMTAVLEKLKTEGLFFIDSRTTSKSTGYDIAKEHGLQYEDRDVFLDNELSQDAIFAQFAELERIAQRNGSAIAIGHPHGETLAALEMWLPTLEERGFNVVKVSSLLKQHDPQAEVLTTEANEQAVYSGGGN